MNSWAGINYLPGNAYLGAGGKEVHYESCNFLIKGSGTDADNQITLGSYGTGKHGIICDSGYVFGETQRSWITISNLDLTALTNQCVLLQGSNHVTVKNVTFSYCAGIGIGLDGGDVDHDNLTIAQNTFIQTGSSAIAGSPALSNTQDWDSIRITGNLFEPGVSSGGPSGDPAISFLQTSNAGVGVQNTITNLEIDNNTFNGVNYERENPSFLIQVSRYPFPASPIDTPDHSNCVRQYSVFGVYIHDNTATNIGGGIGVHFSVGSNIARNQLSNFRATTVIGLFFSENMYTEENVINEINTGAFADYWDGIGIDYDYCTRNGIIARNYISNAHGSDVANGHSNGQGITVYAADSHKIYANVLVNNRYGVMFGNDLLTGNYNPNELYNNTIVSSQLDGISTLFDVEQENHIYNNIIAYNGRYGLRADGLGEQHLSNNLFYGNAVSDIVSNEAGTGNLYQNPGLIGGDTVDAFRILTGSPAYRAGTLTSEQYTDYDGRLRLAPQSIGAFEPLDNNPGCFSLAGDVTFNDWATLLIDIGGTTPCTEHDRITVANQLTINDATLKIVLIGFVPAYGERFDIMEWGSLTGNFGTLDTSAASLPAPLVWDTSQLYLTGKLIVDVQHFADGDLAPWDNPDGLINAADVLIATQLAVGLRTPGPLQYAHGDMNVDGVIDLADLLLIQKAVLQ